MVCCSTRGVFPGVLVVDDLGKQVLHIFCCGIRSAVIATISSARSDSTAHHTSCSITPSQLSNASRRESLASVFLTKMCHETAVRVSDTRLAAAVWCSGTGHRRWCWGWAARSIIDQHVAWDLRGRRSFTALPTWAPGFLCDTPS